MFLQCSFLFITCSFLISSLDSLDLGGARKVQKPQDPQKREEVNIAVVYQHYAGRSKSYDKAFKEVIRKINDATAVSSLRRLATRYIFSAVDCILPTGAFYVKEVLDCLCNNVTSNNVALIIFVTASETYDSTTAAEQYFLTAASYTGIPIIAWNADNAGFTFENDLSPYRIIQMAPPIEHQARAMLAYSVVTIGPNSGPVREELEMFSNKSKKFEMIHHCHMDTRNNTDVDLKLAEVKKNQAKIILLYANAAQAGAIFSQAEKHDMIGEKYLWIGTQSVKGTQTTVKASAQAGMLCVNFHTVSNAMFAPRDDILPSLSNWHPNCSEPHYCNCAPMRTFRCDRIHMKAAFVKGNPFHVDDGHDSFFYTFEKTGRLRNSILQISNLRTNSKGEKTWEKVGIFTNNELKMADVQWPGERANPPQGTADKFHVKVVTLHEPPFITVSDVDPDTQKCPGNQGSICDWGDVEYTDEAGVKKNRTLLKCCSGYCVDLLNKLATDIGFTYTLYKVRDENGVLSPTAFLEPFEYSTWVIILFVCIHVAAISIFVFEWVSPYSFNMQKYPPPEHKFSLFRSYWLVWATLFSASVTTDVPKSTVSRLMALVWAAFGLTFLAVYTANLAAFMITRVQYYDLSGIHDPMLNFPQDQKPPFRFGTVDGGNTHETMKRNWHKMHEYVKGNKFFRMNISAGVDAVKNEELDAFIYDAVVLDYWAGKDANCALMTQKGDLERLQNFWLTGACTPDSHSQTQSAPLGIENFLSAFVLLAGGIIVSVIVLGFEHIYCMHLRKPLQKIDPNGWCGIISMAMGKSLTFTEAVDRVQEWRSRTQSLASNNSPQLKRRRSANLKPADEPQEAQQRRRSPRFLQVETNL
ncbi:unnamed protein product [Caenorhabditis sp. 36 PRJEB53466]|nr:unnamed protein product [Caenorhabditis sp. 36 PRJEB53466]